MRIGSEAFDPSTHMNRIKNIDLKERNAAVWRNLKKYSSDPFTPCLFYAIDLYERYRKEILIPVLGMFVYDTCPKTTVGGYDLVYVFICASIVIYCYIGTQTKCPKCKTWFARLSDPFLSTRNNGDYRPSEAGTKTVTKNHHIKNDSGDTLCEVYGEASVSGRYYYGTDYYMCKCCGHTWKEGTSFFIEDR